MKLDDILSQAGKKKARKRVGRGDGSGHGKTSCRGHKGRGQRSGASTRLGYAGGTNPALARLPKRGFNNANFRTDYQIVNIASLEKFDADSRVDAEVMAKAGLIDDANKLVKVLGNGELSKKLTVVASKFSATAAEKIAKAGGATETV